MLLVMRTFSSDEHNNENYDYAVIKLEEYEAIKLHQYWNLFKFLSESQGDLIEMSFKSEDVTCEFYPCDIFDKDGEVDVMPDGIREQLDNVGYAIFDKEYYPPFTPKDAHAPEMTYLVVSKEGFLWTALPHNSMIKVDTQALPTDILAKVI